MKIIRDLDLLHPILKDNVLKIQKEIIDAHNMPMRVFETGRTKERHEFLLQRGKTKDVISRHRFAVSRIPPIYATAVDFVYYDGKWSWNLRDSTISAWYTLFGNLVVDLCPDLLWYGYNRKSVNLCHFELNKKIWDSK